jgi:signal transduction histidine kinase
MPGSPSSTGPDPTRASAPPALADALAAAEAALDRGDAASARVAAQAARMQAQASGAGLGWQGHACVFQAVAAQLLSDYPVAFERAQEALAFLDEHQVALRARALNSCFVVCAECGDVDRALEFSRRAFDLAEAGGDLSGAARAMHNRATLLGHLQQYDAALQCMQEAVSRYDALPQEAAYAWFCRVSMALNCLSHARQLAQGSDPAAAHLQRQLAARLVPPLRPAAAGAPHAAELTALDSWIAVRSELGHLGAARQGLRQYLRLVRLGGRVPRFQAYAVRALAAYHFHAGRTDKALQLQQAAVARLGSGGNRLYQLTAQHRLVQMLAAAGRHGQAMAALRAAHAVRAGLSLEQAGLRDRLAALERQVRKRVAEQREAVAHQQRLGVIGRLLADIHLALDRPLAGMHAALLSCAGVVLPLPAQVLQQVIEQVDAAAGLVRQLNMFAHRAAPQPTVVELDHAVQDAWAGIAPWRRAPAQAIHVSGHARVRVDGQRLAVLLRILLMEAERAGLGSGLQVQLGLGHGTGRLEVHAPGPHHTADRVAEGVGLALCREIAQEMGGELVIGQAPVARPGFALQLPAA